jgi:hypothetical protein
VSFRDVPMPKRLPARFVCFVFTHSLPRKANEVLSDLEGGWSTGIPEWDVEKGRPLDVPKSPIGSPSSGEGWDVIKRHTHTSQILSHSLTRWNL